MTDLEKLINHLKDGEEARKAYCQMFRLDVDKKEDDDAFRYCLYGFEDPSLFGMWRKYKADLRRYSNETL